MSSTYDFLADPTVQEVRAWAIQHHGDQRYGSEPYGYHLDAVAKILNDHWANGRWAMQIAYCHDLVEDTGVTLDEIGQRYGSEVAQGVAFCTDEPGPNRRTKKAATYRRVKALFRTQLGGGATVLRTWTELALWVKLADRLANLQEAKQNNPGLLKMYRREHEDFRETYWVYRDYPASPGPQSMGSIWREMDEVLHDA